MSLTSQSVLTNPASRLNPCIAHIRLSKTPHFSLSFSTKPFINSLHFNPICSNSPNSGRLELFSPGGSRIKVFESDGAVQQSEKFGIDYLNLDAFLSVAEFLSLASAAVLSVGYVLNWVLSKWQKGFAGLSANGFLAWQVVALVSAVMIGVWIRRRQWLRICNGLTKTGNSGVNLVERIEKLEEDLRGSATIIRVLSRQLEKLGIRFRVTRKALKGPITETAALAQKNSEATQALAVQEDILEKELGEIQKVLLAMQEQQLKQLELILAIGKSGKLWESRRESDLEQDTVQSFLSVKEGVKEVETHKTHPVTRHKGTKTDEA